MFMPIVEGLLDAFIGHYEEQAGSLHGCTLRFSLVIGILLRSLPRHVEGLIGMSTSSKTFAWMAITTAQRLPTQYG